MTNKTGLPKLILSVLLAMSVFIAACSSDAADETAELVVAATEVPAEPETPEASEEPEVPVEPEAPEEPEADEPAAVEGDASGYLGSYTLDDAEFGTQITVAVEGETRTIQANALPDHETGAFPNDGNPNAISAQDRSYEYSTEPTFVGNEVELRTPGVAVNGVKFEPGTAETVTCESGETYRVEALQEIYDLGLDFNNAHVQPTGEYHYHGASQLLADAYATGEDLVHVGFAADGFLMYYSMSGAYESGYELSTDARSGTDCIGSGALRNAAVEVDGSTPDGTYTSDWLHTDTGDLDACNGTMIDGTYAYVITDEFPFVSRCLNGDVAEQGPGGGGGEGGGAAGGGAQGAGGPDLTEAAATLGISVEELEAALGGLPPDIDAAAATLGISVDELTAALPAPPGQ